MKDDDPVRRFLYEVYGYGRIAQYVRKPLGPRQPLLPFLSGTILGTYAQPSDDSRIVLNGPPVTRMAQTHETPWAYRKELPYHIEAKGLFRGYDEDGIANFLRQHVAPLFPEGRLHLLDPHKVLFDAPYLGLHVTGTQGGKVVTIDCLCPSEETQYEINNIVVHEYERFLATPSHHREKGRGHKPGDEEQAAGRPKLRASYRHVGESDLLRRDMRPLMGTSHRKIQKPER